MELAEKLEAAMVGYLQSLTPPYPDYFDADTQVKPGEGDETIDAQYIRCRAADQGDEEYPLDTGNFWWPCEVELRTPAAVATDHDVTEAVTTQADRHKAMAAILEDAILVDDLAAQLTAAATALGAGYELTVMGAQSRQPSRSQDDEVYSSGWSFRVYCCPVAFA